MRSFKNVAALLIAKGVLFGLSGHAQSLAFPGALGYGAYATGGRNGTVYHVTNLNDSGAGSFRDAVSQGGRTVVFDVGGHVQLASAVSVQGNMTIAGQTAPGGICLDAGEVSFSPRANIICRYLRIRPGSSTSSVNDDCLSLYESTNVIVDHVSLGFGPYDNIDAVSANNISIQNCIDANPIGQQFGAHMENVGAFCSWQYNLFANSHNRNPLAKINDTYINNVLYNCSAGYTTHTSTPFKHDIVDNYFVAGPAYGDSSDFPWYQVDNNQSIYYAGNLFDANENSALDGSTTTPYWYQGGSGGTVLSTPWSSWTTVIPTMTAPLAWRYDVSAAGAFPRDDVDSLIISQVKTLGNGTAGYTAGTTGPDGSLYTSQAQTGLSNNGYGSFAGGTAPANYSGDGIADYWKLANNMSTNLAYPLTNAADGYTPLEHYLNFLGAPHAVTQTNAPVSINLSQFTAGFSSSAAFSLTNATNGTVTLVNATNADFVPAANFSGLGTFTFTVTDSGLSLSTAVAVCVTPIPPPASAANFNGALVVVATNSTSSVTAMPSNLTWRGDGTANVWNTSVSNWLNGANVSAFKNGDTATFDDTGSATPAINLTTTVSPGAVFFQATQNYTLSGAGALSGSGPFTKSGSGTLFVNTTNSTYSGALGLNSGSLVLGSGSSLGTGTLTLNSGTILGLSANNTIYPANPVVVSAGQTGTITNVGIGNSFSGTFSSGDSNSVLNLFSSMSFAGSDTNQFNGFTGTINIATGAGMRLVATGGTLGSFNPQWVINGTLQPRNAGNTILLGAFTGAGTLTGPQSNSGTGNTLYVIGGNNTSATFGGVISSNTAVAGSQVLVNKIGTGTLRLTGANTFTGGLTVSAGTLLVNNVSGSATGTGPLEILSGATLAGTGMVAGPTTVNNGATFSPGNPSGTLTLLSNLTLNASSLLQFALGTNCGSVAVGGSLTLAGQLAATNVGGFGAGSYALFTYGGALTLGNLQLVAAPAGYNYSFDTNTPGVVKLVATLPPPPVIGKPTVRGGQFIFGGSGGTPEAMFYVVTSTDLAAPVANWIPLLTNQFDADGNFVVTNGPATNAQYFYRLQLQ
jgi:autotransporter-associated beta strand protein